VFVCVEGGTGTDEFLPPAGAGIEVCGVGVGGGGEAGEEDDGVAAVCVEGAPCFVGDCVFGEDAAPVKEEGFMRVE
jgi:hypothetical protein